MNTMAARRRHPAVLAVLLLLALLVTGGIYTAIDSGTSAQASAQPWTETQVEAGKKLFAEGCSSCHGLNAQGSSIAPTLLGAGQAAVDFQVSTGRMPLAAPGSQAPVKKVIYSQEEIDALAAFVGSLAPGPLNPTQEQLDTANADLAEGGELFRTNCAQCHSFAGKGGALSNGTAAPTLMNATPKQIYQAMVTGPANMPVFSNATQTIEQKQSIIKWIGSLQANDNPGGLSLSRLGPVTEGLFVWIVGLAALLVVAIWIGVKAK